MTQPPRPNPERWIRIPVLHAPTWNNADRAALRALIVRHFSLKPQEARCISLRTQRLDDSVLVGVADRLADLIVRAGRDDYFVVYTNPILVEGLRNDLQSPPDRGNKDYQTAKRIRPLACQAAARIFWLNGGALEPLWSA